MRRAALAALLLALLGCGFAMQPSPAWRSSLPSFQRGMTLAHELSRTKTEATAPAPPSSSSSA